MAGMTRQDLMKLVNRYIGVVMGDLQGFSYNTLAAFYTEYCDLPFESNALTGTKRERFTAILKDAAPFQQAEIIRGVIDKLPPNPEEWEGRTEELRDYFLNVAAELEGGAAVGSSNPGITSAVVERAIADAESLIRTNGATSGVDRIHTVLHGYLRAVCDSEEIEYSDDMSMRALLRLLRQHHPAFHDLGPRAEDVENVLNSMGTIMHVMDPIRNRASVAHPNRELLEEPEAMLVINSARTLLHYLDCKLSGVNCE